MTSAIGTTTAITPVTADTHAAASAAASTGSAKSFASSTNTAASTTASSNDTNVISPRLAFNSVVGVVTQFLSSSGQVEVQLPSKVAIAYLEAGLTEQGSPKAPANADASALSSASA